VTGDFGIVTAGFGTPGKIGHDQPKSAVTFNRNGRSRSAEMGGHVRPKYAAGAVLPVTMDLNSPQLGIIKFGVAPWNWRENGISAPMQ
jgi:hypothetical protein